MKEKALAFALLLLAPGLNFSQNFPGGVPGAEIWYKAGPDGEFRDHSENNIEVQGCSEAIEDTLFNFNPALYSGELCFSYMGGIDGENNHSVFMVSEPDDDREPVAQVRTTFNDFARDALQAHYPVSDSLSRSGFVFHNKEGYASKLMEDFAPYQNAHVHHYTFGNYDIDKIFKSYGQQGESEFIIGQYGHYPQLDNQGRDFTGLFPEYISFGRKLTLNERNRVDSYLCLKYGITQWDQRPYLNSRNKVFWDKGNNNRFATNIFGMGRDDISGLHQVQCESAHNRDYLVAATVKIVGTNREVLDNSGGIGNNNFLVFGDTGGSGLVGLDNNLERLGRVWLSQVTGENIREVPMAFRLSLANEFQPYLADIQSGDKTVWMLHDPYANNTKVSGFDNGHIEYYRPFHLDLGPGEAYAHYNGVLFDPDHSGYDQYTFAIGPDMIIQVRYVQWQCVGECFEVEIVITGKQPEGEVLLISEEGEISSPEFNPELSEQGDGHIYNATVCGDQEYTVEIRGGDTGNELLADHTFYVEAKDNTLDLGPDRDLTSLNSPILLDAGQGIDDPDGATYQWYYMDYPEPLPHTGSTLSADQPGLYRVIVTTGDMSCRLEDEIMITASLNGNIHAVYVCDEEANEVTIELENGTPPFTTHLSGNGFDTNYVHHGNTTINGIPSGDYTVSVTDSFGARLTENIHINNSGMGSGSLGPDQMLTLAQPQITLDGTQVFGSSPNYSYQWSLNGNLLSHTSPQITVDAPGQYKVLVTEPNTNCQGEAGVFVGYDFQAHIEQEGDCEEYTNTLNVYIDFGLAPPYTTTFTGSTGQTYTYTHTGDMTVSGIPYDTYEVQLTDDMGNSFVQHDVVYWGLEMDIEHQLIGIINDNCGTLNVWDNYCDSVNYPLYYIDPTCMSSFTLNAAHLMEGYDIDYQWEVNDINLNHPNPVLTFEDGECENLYVDKINYCEGFLTTVTATDRVTGCSLSESVFFILYWCPILEGSPSSRPGGSAHTAPSLKSRIHPNPSEIAATFHYTIGSEENFEGTVEVYSVTGALLQHRDIRGETSYTLPFRILSSGTYFIRTTTPTEVKIDRVIIK